uniref:Uncharacterized protein n=1 Tax=Haplochromis burtoni TaxID=8153 RepID=A0A3Q2V2S5_HAPBU
STLGSGSLHCVDLVRRPQRAQLCLVAWAAVQGVFWHADGKGQVAAHAPDDDGGANVTGLYPHLPTDSGATSGGLVHLLICTAMFKTNLHTKTNRLCEKQNLNFTIQMKNASEPSWSLIPGWEKAATNTFRGQKVGPPCMVAK